MLVQKDFLNKLKDLGINSYEAKIWTALLSRGVSTAGELSDISNVPRSRSYDVLESLEKKGFIVMKIGKPIKYIAVPPKEVLERVKKNVKEEADRNVKLLEEIKETEILNDLTKLHEQGVEMIEPSDITGALKGRDNLYSQLTMMIKEAEKSIILVTSAEGLKRKTEFLLKHLKRAKERGVNIKICAPTKDIKELSALKEVAEIKDLKLRGRFCIVDNTSMMFMMAHDDDVHPTYDIGIWLNTPFFSQTLTQLFELSWDLIKVKQ
jgi:sugar-specific transcriptional regulator TrmB